MYSKKTGKVFFNEGKSKFEKLKDIENIDIKNISI
jgi:hypothetical protein